MKIEVNPKKPRNTLEDLVLYILLTIKPFFCVAMLFYADLKKDVKKLLRNLSTRNHKN